MNRVGLPLTVDHRARGSSPAGTGPGTTRGVATSPKPPGKSPPAPAESPAEPPTGRSSVGGPPPDWPAPPLEFRTSEPPEPASPAIPPAPASVSVCPSNPRIELQDQAAPVMPAIKPNREKSEPQRTLGRRPARRLESFIVDPSKATPSGRIPMRHAGERPSPGRPRGSGNKTQSVTAAVSAVAPTANATVATFAFTSAASRAVAPFGEQTFRLQSAPSYCEWPGRPTRDSPRSTKALRHRACRSTDERSEVSHQTTRLARGEPENGLALSRSAWPRAEQSRPRVKQSMALVATRERPAPCPVRRARS